MGLILIGLCLPWLYPLASGPSPAVMQWLLTLMCSVIVLLLNSSLSIHILVQAWLVASLVSSVAGLLQYFGYSEMLSPWISQANMGEAFANLRQRNQFATLTNMGLVALLWWSTQRRPRQSEVVIAVTLLAVANAASASRTGLLQLVVLGALVWLWGGMRHLVIRRLMLVVVVAYLAAVVVLPALLGLDPAAQGMWGRLRDGSLTCSSRVTLWSNVLQLIGQRPWLGWGWGELDYAHFITLYTGPRFCEIMGNAHNLPLHLAVELGLPVALLICCAVVWLTWRAKPWRETDPTRQMAWSMLAMIALHSLVEYPLWYGPFQMALVISLGLLWRPPRTGGLQGARNPLSTWLQGGAAILLAATAYAAWDYHRVSQIYLPPEQRSVAYRDGTLRKVRGSWLFRDQVKFAEFTLTPLTRNSAVQLLTLGQELLHFSPEAAVVEKLIESAILLGRDEEARFYMVRYRAAYPLAYQQWRSKDIRLL